uniref:Vesicle transport protein n=1 Tax=Macrostomum lignano TaxID=282301 RepID=A0A1I8G3F2_9PLAT
QIFQAISILYVTHVMQLGSHVRFCTLTYLLVALTATPGWHLFSCRFGKKLSLQIGSVGTAACCLLAGLMPGGIVPLFYFMVTAAGVLGANALLLPWASLPDVIQVVLVI